MPVVINLVIIGQRVNYKGNLKGVGK